MSLVHQSPVARRRFLLRFSQAAAGLSALLAAPARLLATSRSSHAAAPDPDAWISGLTGEYKVMIHVHEHIMTALVDARTMLANARDHYGIPEAEHSIAIIVHGKAIQGLLRDETWQRFALGEFYKVTDPRTGLPAVRNIYLTPQEGEPEDAAVDELMRRKVTFVVCGVAVRNLARKLAPPGQNPDAIREELIRGLVSGVVLVPDVFVSMERAQRRGVSYIFTDRGR